MRGKLYLYKLDLLILGQYALDLIICLKKST